MKWFPSRPRCLGATALAAALLGTGGGAGAVPSFQSSPDPAFVGGSFSLVWSDGTVNPATGFDSFDVRMYFNPEVLALVRGTAGSAFGNAATRISHDVFGSGGGPGTDGIDDPGWARFSILRDAGVQPSAFGTDILRLEFTVLSLADGFTDLSFFPSDEPAAPQPGEYPFPASLGSPRVGILAVPEPATAALMLASLGLLWTQGGRRRREPPKQPPPVA